MKLALERQIQLAFIIALLLLLTLGFFAYRSANSMIEALSLENHTQEVFTQLNNILSLAVDAETGGRGFVITGNEAYLEPFNKANLQINQNLAVLRGLVADNPKQSAEIPRLESLIGEKLSFVKTTIEIRRNQGLEAAGKRTESGIGKRMMDEIRLSIGGMKDEETRILKTREKDLKKSVNNTLFLLFFGTAAGIISLGLANFAVYRAVGQRRQAEEKIRDANKNLEKRIEERTHELSEKNDELKEQIKQREQSEHRRRIALEAGNLGTWILDPKTDKAEIDDQSLLLFGLSAEEFDGTRAKAFSRIHEEDLPAAQNLFQKTLKDRINFNAEFRVLTVDGAIRWNHCTGQPLLDENGEVIQIIGNCRDITPHKETEQERERLLKNEQAARKDAEIANRLRDEFLATVSHELRAPLNSILGWGRLLEKGNLDEATTRKAINTIVRNAESQNRLIEDLLDVSRIISGKLRLEVITIKPINIVESALETVRPAAEAKGITLEIKEDADVSHISGDPNRLQQVVWNLLSNAIKFTPNDGKVTLEIERSDDFVEIRVKDTGVGIKEEFLPHVFDRFRQADASSIRKFGGLGLGLAIVRYITEMHGGTVDAFSEGEGKGSTFIVRLPLITSPHKDESEAELARKSSVLNNSPEISLDGLLILVVDDEEDTRQLLVQSLAFHGATVISANSAKEALSEIEEKNPDVLVSDIGMPDEDGYSLIRKVRALPDKQQRNIPAIALTAFTRAQDRMRALASGFQNHVSKPVEPDELATVIASLTGRLQINEPD
ncbi:MAG: CHASE3 domain-containing protein [Acidobacteria bacterium]|nr:CHASE3 domain-containing protein [Acidobacteriota bacterium]